MSFFSVIHPIIVYMFWIVIIACVLMFLYNKLWAKSKAQLAFEKLMSMDLEAFKKMDLASQEALLDLGTLAFSEKEDLPDKITQLYHIIDCLKGYVRFSRGYDGVHTAWLGYDVDEGLVRYNIDFVDALEPIRIGSTTYQYDTQQQCLINQDNPNDRIEKPATRKDCYDVSMRGSQAEKAAKYDIGLFYRHGLEQARHYILSLTEPSFVLHDIEDRRAKIAFPHQCLRVNSHDYSSIHHAERTPTKLKPTT